jgi:branched-chain amino acid transport system permease protein
MTQYLTLQPMRVRLLALLIVWALHIVLPLALQGVPYAVFILTQMIFFTAFAFSFNFLFGFTRQLYLCIGAFAGISAYVTGIAVRDGLTGVLEAVVLGTLLTTALGWIVSVLSVRRRLVVIFTGIFTLAITLVFNNMVVGLVSITGGETGFRIRLADLGPLEVLPKNLRFYYVVTAVLIVLTAISYHMVYRTKVGYAYRCIMDDEFSAELVGINVSRVKTLTAAFSSGLAGLTGALYGLFNQLISPSYYSFTAIDLPSQIIVILGGRATFLGPFIGSAIITAVNEALRFLGPFTQVVYGLILLLLLAFFRNGLVDFIRRRVVGWFY